MVLVSFMVPVVGNTADTPKPLGLLPFKRSFGRVPTERKKKLDPDWATRPVGEQVGVI